MRPEKSHVNGGIQKVRRNWTQKLKKKKKKLAEHIPNITDHDQKF